MLAEKTHVTTLQWRTWSCDFLLELINSSLNPHLVEAEIKALLDAYENAFSRFKTTSEISQLSQGESIEPSNLFQKSLRKALAINQVVSAEFFNPHVNLAARGYDVSLEKLGQQPFSGLISHLNTPLFPNGLLKMSDQQLQLKPQIVLDFGGFLKGLVAEVIANKYAPHCQGVVVNLGGDLCVRGRDENRDYFEIGIYNPVTQQDHLVRLKNQSLCTSGSYKRTWKNGTQTQHHITNPITQGSSTSDFVSISFWGRDGALCDALATAAFNADQSVWQRWQKTNPELYYLAIKKSGEIVNSSF